MKWRVTIKNPDGTVDRVVHTTAKTRFDACMKIKALNKNKQVSASPASRKVTGDTVFCIPGIDIGLKNSFVGKCRAEGKTVKEAMTEVLRREVGK